MELVEVNYFCGTKKNPFHISIGAIVINNDKEVCCHYFERCPPESPYRSYDNFYLLMRETIEPGESIEECLHRGLQEEFGMTADLLSYVGSIVSHYPKDEIQIQKTTLYFLCKLINQDISSRRLNDAERSSKIVWVKV